MRNNDEPESDIRNIGKGILGGCEMRRKCGSQGGITWQKNKGLNKELHEAMEVFDMCDDDEVRNE